MTLISGQTARPFFVLMSVSLQMACASVWAQSSCSSDGQRAPRALVERFISADCDTCWADPATALVKATELALDWIVPSAKGDDAPLSAAAIQEALYRLQALRQDAPKNSVNLRRPLMVKAVAGSPKLRVARGVALGGYMGTSIEFTVTGRSAALSTYPITAWLLLVEEIPAGTDGTPVARNLVRNALQLEWNKPLARQPDRQPSGPPAEPPSARIKAGQRFYESRPMSIPAGTNPDRIRVVGWVDGGTGKVLASAASVCTPS